MSGFVVLGLSAKCWDCVFGYLVFGVGFLFGSVPFKTCPLFALMFVSFFFLVVGMFVDDVCLSVFLSLSGAGETQTPVWGFGIPLVFLLRGQALRLRPVPCAPRL